MHYSMVRPSCLNFRVITANFLGVRIFRNLKVVTAIESPHDKTKKVACAPSEDSDQPRHPPSLISLQRMPRLIWVFAGRTCHFVGFVMRWLIFFFSNVYRGPSTWRIHMIGWCSSDEVTLKFLYFSRKLLHRGPHLTGQLQKKTGSVRRKGRLQCEVCDPSNTHAHVSHIREKHSPGISDQVSLLSYTS